MLFFYWDFWVYFSFNDHKVSLLAHIFTQTRKLEKSLGKLPLGLSDWRGLGIVQCKKNLRKVIEN